MFPDAECMFPVGERMFRIGERTFSIAKHKMYRAVVAFPCLFRIPCSGGDEKMDILILSLKKTCRKESYIKKKL